MLQNVFGTSLCILVSKMLHSLLLCLFMQQPQPKKHLRIMHEHDFILMLKCWYIYRYINLNLPFWSHIMKIYVIIIPIFVNIDPIGFYKGKSYEKGSYYKMAFIIYNTQSNFFFLQKLHKFWELLFEIVCHFFCKFIHFCVHSHLAIKVSKRWQT